MEDELVALDRAAEIDLELEPLDEVDVHLGVVALEAALAGGLGAVHREVGVAEQLVGAPRIRARDREAEAAAHEDLLPVDDERRLRARS